MTTNAAYQRGDRSPEACVAHREYQRTWRAKQPGYAARKSRERARRFRLRIGHIKLERGCADCGYREHACALDFDHLPGEPKVFTLAYGYKYPWSMVLLEIAKCEVVCANCHRVRTAGRRES